MKGVVESLEIKPDLIIKKGSRINIKLGHSVCSRTVTNITFNDNVGGSLMDFDESPYTIEVVADYGGSLDKYDANQLAKMIV